jgi:FkbM family methyltransferase
MNIKRLIKKLVNMFGLDICRLNQSARYTMAGLRSRNITTVIDVGANEGQFARSISQIFPKCELYCFEPLENPFKKLLEWAKTQNERVHCFKLAIGDREGEVEMHCHDQHTPSSSLLPSTAHGHQVYPQTRSEIITKVLLTTLDLALEKNLNQMSRGILLKLDVQGFEDRVLRGAEKVLAKCEACILEACIDPLYEGQADFNELTRLLTQAGYKYAGNLDQVHGKDGRVIFLDAVFLK